VTVCFLKDRPRKAAVREEGIPILLGRPAIVLGQDAG
jgi:hypothetical protein